MAKKGRPNRCNHQIYYSIVKTLRSPANVTNLRQEFIGKDHAMSYKNLQGYIFDLVEAGLLNLDHDKPRTTKHKFRPKNETPSFRDIAGSTHYLTTTKGEEFIKNYEALEELIAIPPENTYETSFAVKLSDGREGEFPLTPANLAVLEAKLGKDSKKWVGHKFDARVLSFRNKEDGTEYLGWAIIADPIE